MSIYIYRIDVKCPADIHLELACCDFRLVKLTYAFLAGTPRLAATVAAVDKILINCGCG